MNCTSLQECSLRLLSSWEISASRHFWKEVRSIDLAEGMREETKSVARRRNKKTGECGKWKTGFLAPIGIKKTEAKEVQ